MNPTHRLTDDEIIDLAEPYALHALDDLETHRLESALHTADPVIRERFDSLVASARQTMADQAAAQAVPPPAGGFDRVLAEISSDDSTSRNRGRPRTAVIVAAAAAALVVAVGLGVLAGRLLAPDQPAAPESSVVLAAPDARTGQARIGAATVSLVYSRKSNAAVVLMNDVPPPAEGTVYQMWLMDPGGGARSRGTMGQGDVRPTTTADVPALDGATSFGISIESPGGGQRPSERVVATIPLAAS